MKKKILKRIAVRVYFCVLHLYETIYYHFLYSPPNIEFSNVKRYVFMNQGGTGSLPSDTHEKLPSQLIQSKIVDADVICSHTFDLLGSGPKKVSANNDSYQPIDWHVDFKSGYRWNPKEIYYRIKLSPKPGVDVKVPWELSRCQHLVTLGQAYALTKAKKYSDEFQNQIEDWIRNNRVGFGVNWSCTMDVAIRAANWLVAQEYFDEQSLTNGFWKEFYTSIYEHGKFIRSHLENKRRITTNHYIADLAGLFFIAVYCPFFEESKIWKEFAVKELVKEIDQQVYDDGCIFEASTSYHRLSLELFFYSELLASRSGMEFPQEYCLKVRKMFEFTLYCVKPNGHIPQIGDNDSGRFLLFSKRKILDHRYLLLLATNYYRDNFFKIENLTYDEEAFWLFDEKNHDWFASLPKRSTPIKSKAFPNAGWYILRNRDDYCFVSCGSNGQGGSGGHAHNDKLSFELVLNGNDIILDPGSYIYLPNPAERNKFRSTKYHNCVSFSGEEQNTFSLGIFNLPDRVEIVSADLKETEEEITFAGEIKYLSYTHKRSVRLFKESGTVEINDSFSPSDESDVQAFFHLAPGLAYKDGYIHQNNSDVKLAKISTKQQSINKVGYDYSPEYGKKVDAESLFLNNNTQTTFMKY